MKQPDPTGSGKKNGAVPFPPAITQWTQGPEAADTRVPLAPPFYLNIRPATKPAVDADALEAPWAPMAEEGVVEATFAEDVSRAADTIRSSEAEFPIDAFMIPEDSSRVPTGLNAEQVEAVIQHTEHPELDTQHELSDRFEMLSRRLRAENLDALLPALAQGDHFERMVAPLIEEYFSAKNG